MTDPDPARHPTLGRVVMVIPTYNEVDNLAWIVGRLRAAAARRRRARRRRRAPRTAPGAIADELAAADPQVHGAAPRGARRASARRTSHGFAGALERGLRRDRRDGRRRLAPARAAAPAARRRSSDADLVIGSRWVPGGIGRQLAAAPRAALPRRQPLRPAAARHRRPRRHRRLPPVPPHDAGADRPRPRSRPPATCSRPTWSPGPAAPACACARCRSSSSSASAATRR